jgi:hypothetical protein
MLERLVQFRKQIMSSKPENRNIRIYHKRFDVREVPHIIVDMDNELGKSEDKLLVTYWGSIVKENMRNAKFQSKRKLEFEYLISQQVYRETTIKLRLPNELIIEARFGPL